MASIKHTTILGVGLIGGSLGLAIKQRGLADEVVGVGYRDSTLKLAQKRGAIDRWTLDIAEGVADADIVVLCTPVGLVVEKAAAALAAMKPGSILTDVASTKAVITHKIEAILPEGVAFVPAHPMAGEVFIASIYEALAQSPQWKDCVFIITYDEHGGFFDHVPPPTAPDDHASEGFDQLGFRVPSVVIGPWVKPGALNNYGQYFHGSYVDLNLLSELSKHFGLVE